MAHQPNLKKEPNIVEGIKAIRNMHLRALKESHLPAADEMLYPNNYAYLEDVLSYVAVGARSVENQQHRLTCSGLDIPVGMKNPTSGDFDVMFNAVHAAQAPHVFSYNGWEVKTSGNPLTHCILRGRDEPVRPEHSQLSLRRPDHGSPRSTRSGVLPIPRSSWTRTMRTRTSSTRNSRGSRKR